MQDEGERAGCGEKPASRPRAAAHVEQRPGAQQQGDDDYERARGERSRAPSRPRVRQGRPGHAGLD